MTSNSPQLLKRHEVEALVGLSCSTIYRKMRQKGFPEPLKLGRAVRWRASEVQAWIDALPRASGHAAAV